MGRPICTMSRELVLLAGRPCDLPVWAVSPNPYLSFVPASSIRSKRVREESQMRFFGLDVHRDFCEVAVAEDGELRAVGRVPTTPAALRG